MQLFGCKYMQLYGCEKFLEFLFKVFWIKLIGA